MALPTADMTYKGVHRRPTPPVASLLGALVTALIEGIALLGVIIALTMLTEVIV